MKRCLIGLLMAFTLLSGCSSTLFSGVAEREAPSQAPGLLLDVPPAGESTSSGQVGATVYFRYKVESLMAPVYVNLTPTAGKSVEQLIVERLIQGPDAEQQDLTKSIHSDTRVLDITQYNDFLAITLSKEFLQPPAGQREDSAQRRLMAVYSIVNSITEMGIHSRVLIKVDSSGSGTDGERISRQQAGFLTQEDLTIEPLAREIDLVYTPEKTLRLALEAYRQKDWDGLNNMIAARDTDGTQAPSRAELSEVLGQRMTLLEYTLGEGTTVWQDGSQATVNVDCTFSNAAGQPQIHTMIPLRLIRGNEIWQVAYSSLEALLPEQ